MTQLVKALRRRGNINKNNDILGKSVLLRRYLTICVNTRLTNMLMLFFKIIAIIGILILVETSSKLSFAFK